MGVPLMRCLSSCRRRCQAIWRRVCSPQSETLMCSALLLICL